MSLPPDLQKVLDEIDDADRAGAQIASELTDEQFHWQPDGGTRWSVALCLEHLTTSNEVYGSAMRQAVDTARQHNWTRRGPLAPGLFGRMFVRSLEPPVKRRTRAPGKIKPASGHSREEILRRYHQAHELVRQTIRDSAAIDANRATFANPFIAFVRVKVATGLQVIAAHDRRHLWQARQVVARPDFPQVARTPAT